MAPTPDWAVYGSAHRGFDPFEKRHFRQKIKKEPKEDFTEVEINKEDNIYCRQDSKEESSCCKKGLESASKNSCCHQNIDQDSTDYYKERKNLGTEKIDSDCCKS